MVAVAGLRGTGDFGEDERPKNFREMILWLQPNGRSPLTALLSKARSEKTDDPEFSWWEEALDVLRVEVDAEAASGVDTLSLESGGLMLVPGDVLLVEGASETEAYTNEIVEVVDVVSDTSIEVSRGVADTTPATIPAESHLTKIGNAYAEGTRSPDVTSRNPEKRSNFAQIFKTAYELTETTKATRFRTGDPLRNDKKRKMFDHSSAMEFAFLFGRPHETTGANGKPKRYTGGLRHFITDHVKVYTDSPSEDVFLEDIYRVFDYETDGRGAGDERLVMAGNGFLNSLNQMARSSNSTRVNFNGVVRTYGMALQEWILPQGRLYVRTHPLMNTHARFRNSAFIVDPTGLIYRYLRDTKPQDNIQHNDEDTHKGQWLSECGLEVHHQRTMAYLGNFVWTAPE